eukprot:6468499-Amphidinium_carterae.2
MANNYITGKALWKASNKSQEPVGCSTPELCRLYRSERKFADTQVGKVLEGGYPCPIRDPANLDQASDARHPLRDDADTPVVLPVAAGAGCLAVVLAGLLSNVTRGLSSLPATGGGGPLGLGFAGICAGATGGDDVTSTGTAGVVGAVPLWALPEALFTLRERLCLRVFLSGLITSALRDSVLGRAWCLSRSSSQAVASWSSMTLPLIQTLAAVGLSLQLPERRVGVGCQWLLVSVDASCLSEAEESPIFSTSPRLRDLIVRTRSGVCSATHVTTNESAGAPRFRQDGAAGTEARCQDVWNRLVWMWSVLSSLHLCPRGPCSCHPLCPWCGLDWLPRLARLPPFVPRSEAVLVQLSQSLAQVATGALRSQWATLQRSLWLLVGPVALTAQRAGPQLRLHCCPEGLRWLSLQSHCAWLLLLPSGDVPGGWLRPALATPGVEPELRVDFGCVRHRAGQGFVELVEAATCQYGVPT